VKRKFATAASLACALFPVILSGKLAATPIAIYRNTYYSSQVRMPILKWLLTAWKFLCAFPCLANHMSC
jgi:hypothetical protein